MRPRVPHKLAEEWRRRLADSGFKDLELPDGTLKESGSQIRSRLRAPNAGGNAEYYRLAAQWLHVAVWRSRRLRRLWELHVEGLEEPAIRDGMGPSPARHHRFIWPLLQVIKKEMHEHYALPDREEPLSLLEQELEDTPEFDRVAGIVRRVHRW